MQIDWWTLGLQTVNALVLIWLLAHFLFRPVVDAIATRQKAAGQLLADAQAAKTAAENLPEGTRASLGADGTSVRLTVARAVTPEALPAPSPCHR